MANTRLAIVDLEGGDQPLSDERGRYWAMQNGEIYNYVELRAELERLGHAVRDDVRHRGDRARVRGSGASAASSASTATSRSPSGTGEAASCFLARDRFGVRPLFLAEYGGDVCFASEAKALLRHPRGAARARPGRDRRHVHAVDDPAGPLGVRRDPRAAPGALRRASARTAAGRATRWWDIDFSPVEDRPRTSSSTRSRSCSSTRSGSGCAPTSRSATTSAAGSTRRRSPRSRPARSGEGRLSAFGVGFADERYDESAAQDAIAGELGVVFHRTVVDAAAIAEAFPRVVELAEKPLLRTAPAPLLRLSGAVQDAGLKVVLTGEGADELFGGYDIFREDKVRRFWARDPSSPLRPLLFRRLNRCLATDPAQAGAFLTRFYAQRPRSTSTTRSTATGCASTTPRAACGCSSRRCSAAAEARRATPTAPARRACRRVRRLLAARGRSTWRSPRSSRATCCTRRATGC